MNNCKYCKADCALRGEENLKECKGHIPMTNADRIRSMSDEDLARWLEYEGGGACAEMCGWLKWLQQPAEKPKEERE